nr:chitinase [uncultured bacterium]
MRRNLLTIAVITLFLSGCATVSETRRPQKGDAKVVMAYFMGGDVAPDMPVELLTHVCYAFANVREDGSVRLERDRDSENLDKLTALKRRNPQLKILLSVGGWDWSKYFSNAALTAQSRRLFCDTALAIVARHRLDGLDIDWEYPGNRGGGNVFRPEDKANFTLLLRDLRARMNAASQGRNLQLTVATGAFKQYLTRTEPDQFAQYVNYVNIMTYDFCGFGEKFTGHHANLRPSPADKNGGHSAADAVENHITAGIPSHKIVLGCAFFGKGWEGGVRPAGSGLFAPVDKKASKAFSASYARLADGYVNKNGYVRYWDAQALAPYLWNPATRTFVTYDDEESVAAKCQYARKMGLAGAMFWEYHGDKDNRLLKTIYRTLKAS